MLLGRISKGRIDYPVKRSKHGRREGETLVLPTRRADLNRTCLVNRLAIYNRLCQFGLVVGSAGHNNLAVLSEPRSGGLKGTL
jgi:hypothetical protein